METKVILVNELDEPIGEMEKLQAHEAGVLHRAFSIFIFNCKNEMLLQKRADEKYHSGGLWTNACCSHPRPGEDLLTAARSRLMLEMGFSTSLTKAFTFIYKTSFDNGLTEYEFDHVFIGRYDGVIFPDLQEASSYAYMTMAAIKKGIYDTPQYYTSWFKIAFPKLEQYLLQHPLN